MERVFPVVVHVYDSWLSTLINKVPDMIWDSARLIHNLTNNTTLST